MNKWLVLAGVLGLACGTESNLTRRENGGAGGQLGQAGAGSALGVAGQSGIGGSSTAGGGGSAGGGPSNFRLGDPLQLVAATGEVPYAIGPNAYGIRGGAFLARAPMGNTITVGAEPGEICISGMLSEVPIGTSGTGNYSQYWGVEFGFNLNQSAPGGGAPPPPAASDAGVDAGADGADAGDAGAQPPAEVAQPWQLGEVIGFSYVIEGSTIDFIRFKALPAGYDRTLEASVFCKELPMATSGEVQNALFSEIDQYCWGANFNLALPTSGGLDNIAWQLPADVAVGERPFDWCLKELRPILAQ
ncbi:MAG: hypothetical protein RL685_5124 [Pseudomonadota bacterium]|jgi:hypothetical protein